MALDILSSKHDSITLVTLKGTIVAGDAADHLLSKTQELLDAGQTQILLDLGEVTFVDSTGISALIKVYAAAKRKGGVVKLLNLTKRIYDGLQIARLSDIFSIYDDLQKAIASFGTGT